MSAARPTTIPVLPCISMPETLKFYQALGFEVTHRQTSPNVYAATHRGDVNLHFMGVKNLDPAKAYSTCLVIVPEVEILHRTLAEGLRRIYGKLPTSGVPRISRMKTGQSRFTVVDVAGNSLIFIRHDAPDDYDEGELDLRSESRLGRALRTAARLRDFKNDDASAAKVLDVALARERDAPAGERARVLVARLEIAVALEDRARADALRLEIHELPLSEEERGAIQARLDAVQAP